jgi:hypothetical protein
VGGAKSGFGPIPDNRVTFSIAPTKAGEVVVLALSSTADVNKGSGAVVYGVRYGQSAIRSGVRRLIVAIPPAPREGQKQMKQIHLCDEIALLRSPNTVTPFVSLTQSSNKGSDYVPAIA